MKCPACNHINPEEANFCSKCAHAISLKCPSCKHTNPGDANYCINCSFDLLKKDVPKKPSYESVQQVTKRTKFIGGRMDGLPFSSSFDSIYKIAILFAFDEVSNTSESGYSLQDWDDSKFQKASNSAVWKGDLRLTGDIVFNYFISGMSPLQNAFSSSNSDSVKESLEILENLMSLKHAILTSSDLYDPNSHLKQLQDEIETFIDKSSLDKYNQIVNPIIGLIAATPPKSNRINKGSMDALMIIDPDLSDILSDYAYEIDIDQDDLILDDQWIETWIKSFGPRNGFPKSTL